MPIGQMLRAIPSSELTEYAAFDSIEPLGERRADIRAGLIAAVTANHSMHPPTKAYSPADFSLKWDWSPPVDNSPKALSARIRALLNSKAGNTP